MQLLPFGNNSRRTVSRILRLCLVIYTSCFCTAAIAAQARVTLTTPAGGEIYVVGQSQVVRVSSRIKILNVTLSRDGGKTFSPLGTINSGATELSQRTTLSWQVGLPASNTCLIRVSDGVFTATSGMFSIGTPSGGVGTVQLADNAVTSNKLADGAVTTSTIADGAVTALKISSGQSSPNFALLADGSGGALWSVLPASESVAANSGDSIVAAINNGATGSTININRLNPNIALRNSPNTFTTGTQTVLTGSDATAGLVVKANSVNQTGDLQQWQDAAGAVKTAINAQGALVGSGAGLTGLNGSNIATGTVPVARLPLAGTAPATAGIVYADNSSISVAPDGKISAVAGGVTLSGDVGGAANNNSIAAGAVTGAKIANGTITGGNLASNSSISTTGTISGSGSGLTNLTAANLSGAVAVANGGTGATTAPAALTNLGVGVVSAESAGRALVATDDAATLICTASPSFTVNTGMPNGFGLASKGSCAFVAGAGATVNDVRVSGQVNPWCALVQTGVDTYDVVGGKP